MIAHFNWERNIFFASSADRGTYLGLDKYFYTEGLVYRLVPFKVVENRNPNALGEINKPKMYDNLMNMFKWGNMDKPGILVDYYTRRLTNNYQVQFSVLADAYLEELEKEQQKLELFKQILDSPGDDEQVIQTPIGNFRRGDIPAETKKAEAIIAENKIKIGEVLDRSLVVMPEENVPHGRVMPSYVSTYFAAGYEEKGQELMLVMMDVFEQELNYYMDIDAKFSASMIEDIFSAYRGAFSLYQTVSIYGSDEEFKSSILTRFYTLTESLQNGLQDIRNYSPNAKQHVDQTFTAFFQRIGMY